MGARADEMDDDEGWFEDGKKLVGGAWGAVGLMRAEVDDDDSWIGDGIINSSEWIS